MYHLRRASRWATECGGTSGAPDTGQLQQAAPCKSGGFLRRTWDVPPWNLWRASPKRELPQQLLHLFVDFCFGLIFKGIPCSMCLQEKMMRISWKLIYQSSSRVDERDVSAASLSGGWESLMGHPCPDHRKCPRVTYGDNSLVMDVSASPRIPKNWGWQGAPSTGYAPPKTLHGHVFCSKVLRRFSTSSQALSQPCRLCGLSASSHALQPRAQLPSLALPAPELGPNPPCSCADQVYRQPVEVSTSKSELVQQLRTEISRLPQDHTLWTRGGHSKPGLPMLCPEENNAV